MTNTAKSLMILLITKRNEEELIQLHLLSIHPSAHDNSIQIPIGNNTGSLPDLTSVHFPSPLHTPIDQEHDHSSSPYSSVSLIFLSYKPQKKIVFLFQFQYLKR